MLSPGAVARSKPDLLMLLWFQLNPSVSSFQRRFVSEIKRCEEMERILGKRAEHLGWFMWALTEF